MEILPYIPIAKARGFTAKFGKAVSYAGLYKSLEESSDARPMDQITVTLIRDTKPEGLFRYFRDHNIRMDNPYPGVYYVLDAVLFRTQIIVGRELNAKDHIWLKALSYNVQKDEMKMLLEKANSLTGKYEKELAESILDVCLKANIEIANELRGDGDMYETLMEFVQPEIDKIVDEREKKAKNAMIQRMIAKGKLTLEEIAEYSDLPIKDVQELAGMQPTSEKNKRLKSEKQKRVGRFRIRDERIR